MSGVMSRTASPASARGTARALAWSLHVVAACVLSYTATAWLVALTSQAAHVGGMARADAVMVAVMLGFVYWLVILVVAFSRRHPTGTWAFLGGLNVAVLLAAVATGAGP